MNYCASALAVLLGVWVVYHYRRNPASWFFAGGMVVLAISTFVEIPPLADDLDAVASQAALLLIAQAFLSGVWLAFSLTYARGNARECLTRWRFVLAAAALLPPVIALTWRRDLVLLVPSGEDTGFLRYSQPAHVLNVLLLLASVLVLMNLEQTFRATVGTMRWRVKYVVLGLAILFGVRIYSLSQSLVFHGPKLNTAGVNSGALLIASIFIAVAYHRKGFAEIDVYPSQALLRSSLTFMLVGCYLVLVGILAQTAFWFGGVGDFELRAFLILLGVAAIAIFLFSDRLRQRVGRFISYHLKRPYHDFRRVWGRLSSKVSTVKDEAGLCHASANLISETFAALSVSIWLMEESRERLLLGASTSQLPADSNSAQEIAAGAADLLLELQTRFEPFDLDERTGAWADRLRELSPVQFRTGGSRICVPLWGGGRFLGLAVLGDRVNGTPYSIEEFDLLKCIGEQIAAALLNLRLTEELMLAKELEAFQTMSTFFVHDLKNAANSLGLMVQNLPIHFQDPAFREDALRGMSATVARINELIARLSLLRNKLDLTPVPTDLNHLVAEALKSLNGLPGIQLETELQSLPPVLADGDKIQSVVTNLLLNAQDAVGPGGRIRIGTTRRDGMALLSVIDEGCGMSAEFLRAGLFRPFQTTKKKGMGIGMFQAKIIVAAHHGNIQVTSEQGKGTTFRVTLPLAPQPSTNS